MPVTSERRIEIVATPDGGLRATVVFPPSIKALGTVDAEREVERTLVGAQAGLNRALYEARAGVRRAG